MKKIILRGATWKYKDINPSQQEVILFVHGHPFNHTMWKYQYGSLNNFRLILPDLNISRSGHLPNLEKPNVFNKLMTAFYKKIKPTFNKL